MLSLPPAEPLGQSYRPTPISAYRDQAVWSTAPAGSKTFTLTLGGRPLAAQTVGEPVEAAVSRGPDGKPAIVVAQARALSALDPVSGSRRRLRTTHGVARSPVLWGDRLAWIEGRDRVYTAVPGRKARRVRTPRGTVYALALRGRRLGLTLNAGTAEGDAQVWLQEVDGSRRRLVRKVSSGEADRSFVGPSFDGNAFYVAQICSGDPSGCPGHGIAYRYAAGRLERASVPLDLGGFAQAGGWSYWVTQHYGACLDDRGEDAPCTVERARLTFSP
jgi:hypothetical protein